MKLTVELVPKSAWFNNLRSLLTKSQWDIVRKNCFRKANNQCEICGGSGAKWPVECHEVWEYNDSTHIQRLSGLVALCPDCHKAKHLGLALHQGWYESTVEHFCKVNNLSKEDADRYIESVFEQWERRSRVDWATDVSWLNDEVD